MCQNISNNATYLAPDVGLMPILGMHDQISRLQYLARQSGDRGQEQNHQHGRTEEAQRRTGPGLGQVDGRGWCGQRVHVVHRATTAPA